MAELTPLQKLDYVLENTHNERDYFHVHEILEADMILSVDSHNLNMILNKLQRDGYVDFIAGQRYVTGQQASEGMSIRRNFDGDLFLANGGYIGEEKRRKTIETNESAYNDRMETYTSRLATWTERLTWAGWFAAGGTFLLFAWEAFQWYYDHFHCS